MGESAAQDTTNALIAARLLTTHLISSLMYYIPLFSRKACNFSTCDQVMLFPPFEEVFHLSD